MNRVLTAALALVCAAALWAPALTQAAEKNPNILVIWGDDIGRRGHQLHLAASDGGHEALEAAGELSPPSN